MEHQTSRFFIDIQLNNTLPDIVVSRVDNRGCLHLIVPAAEFKRLSEQNLKDLIKKLWLATAITEDKVICQR